MKKPAVLFVLIGLFAASSLAFENGFVPIVQRGDSYYRFDRQSGGYNVAMPNYVPARMRGFQTAAHEGAFYGRSAGAGASVLSPGGSQPAFVGGAPMGEMSGSSGSRSRSRSRSSWRSASELSSAANGFGSAAGSAGAVGALEASTGVRGGPTSVSRSRRTAPLARLERSLGVEAGGSGLGSFSLDRDMGAGAGGSSGISGMTSGSVAFSRTSLSMGAPGSAAGLEPSRERTPVRASQRRRVRR